MANNKLSLGVACVAVVVVATLLPSVASDDVDYCAPLCPEGEHLYPHPQNCSMYYQCSYGKAYKEPCPPGLFFSPNSLVCDYPTRAGCEADPNFDCKAHPATSTTETPDDCVPPCPSANAIYPHPHDCTKYFQCAYNVPYLKYCPVGEEYSGPLERCDLPDIAQCTAAPDKPCIAVTNPPTTPKPSCAPPCPWANAYMPNPQDCTKFYICNGLTPFAAECQPGLYYSMNTTECDYPYEAYCIARPDRACDEYLSL